MTPQDNLQSLGPFTPEEVELFGQLLTPQTLAKHDTVLQEGAICQSVWYVEWGCLFQHQTQGITETVIDLHLPGEWMFNHPSLVNQQPSLTTIQAYTNCKVYELSLSHLHYLLGHAPAFVHLGKLFNQPNLRTYLFDNALTPAQKYAHIQQAKPLATQLFPHKMIASFLKIAPETLSRVRAAF